MTLSFEHNEQSARTFHELIKHSGLPVDQIDTKRIIMAILAHSTTRVPNCSTDLVAQIVRQTDKIEYRNEDFEELKNYVIIQDEESLAYGQVATDKRIEQIVKDLVQEAIQKGKINDHMASLDPLRRFRKQYEDAIYVLERGTKGYFTLENIARHRVILTKLLEYYYQNPKEMSTKTYSKISPMNTKIIDKKHSIYNSLLNPNITTLEKVVQYVTNMDNEKAKREYIKLVKQRIVTGKGIVPITDEDIDEIKKEQEEEKIQTLRANEYIKGRPIRTEQELRNIVKTQDKKFIKERLTPQGKEAMEHTRQKIEEDRKLDQKLYQQMEEADTVRRNHQQINTNDIDKSDTIIGSHTNPKRREIIAKQVKANWRKQTELSGEGR